MMEHHQCIETRTFPAVQEGKYLSQPCIVLVKIITRNDALYTFKRILKKEKSKN